METQATVAEAGRPSAKWIPTLLVIFGPALVMLLFALTLIHVFDYSSTSLEFAFPYVCATVVMLLVFVLIVGLLLKQEGSSLLHLINLDPVQLKKQNEEHMVGSNYQQPGVCSLAYRPVCNWLHFSWRAVI